MKRLPRSHLFAVICALSVMVGCTSSDAPPAADSGAGAAAAPATLAGPAPKVMPGALTKPIDQYTPDEFYVFVTSLAFSGGQERPRKCKNAAGCDGTRPTRQTRVLVDAVTTQDSLTAGNTPPFGVVYARALNRGDAEEAMYNLLPGGKYQYYLVVTSAGNTMQWSVQQLDTSPDARRRTVVSSGRFTPCNHPWTAGARADFKTCAQTALRGDSIVRLGLALQGIGDPPIWVACGEGCCVSDP